jgi:hypothetical protein
MSWEGARGNGDGGQAALPRRMVEEEWEGMQWGGGSGGGAASPKRSKESHNTAASKCRRQLPQRLT